VRSAGAETVSSARFVRESGDLCVAEDRSCSRPIVALGNEPPAATGSTTEVIDSGRVQKVLKVNDGRVVTLRALRSGGQHVDHR